MYTWVYSYMATKEIIKIINIGMYVAPIIMPLFCLVSNYTSYVHILLIIILFVIKLLYSYVVVCI